jgi:hypothetical protein
MDLRRSCQSVWRSAMRNKKGRALSPAFRKRGE